MPLVACHFQFLAFYSLLSLGIVRVRVLSHMPYFLSDDNGSWCGHYDCHIFLSIVFATTFWDSLLKSCVILLHSTACGTLHNKTMISPGTDINTCLQDIADANDFSIHFFSYYFLTQNNWKLKCLHEVYIIQINYKPASRPGRIQE